jgi:hypothetical protein
MAGSIESCTLAVQRAYEKAQQSLGKARPILALVFPDIAWQLMLESKPGAEAALIHKLLGEEVPVAGGYVLGHLAKQNETVQFYNQQVQVILFAAKL